MTTINVYDGVGTDLVDALARIETKLDQLTRDLAVFAAGEVQSDTLMEEDMSDISARIDTLRQEVAEQADANASAMTLLTNLTTNLQVVRDDLAARGVTEEQLAALDAEISAVSDNTDGLAAAVAETPSA